MSDGNDPKVAAAIAEARQQNKEAMERHPVVSEEGWLKQRLALMEKEKQYMRMGDELAAQVRALPWVKIEKNYTFYVAAGRPDTGRSLWRPQAAVSQTLHDGAASRVAVPGMFSGVGPCRWSAAAFRASRYVVCCGVTCAD